jgi:hypothetical protein
MFRFKPLLCANKRRLVAVQGLARLSLGGFAIGLCGTARG